MHTKVVYQATKALSRIGCAVLRFNFRGAGASAGTFDNGPGEQEDFRAALDYMAAQYPGAPLWAAGMSFGAWVALSVGADDPRVSALLGIAPPVHALRLRRGRRQREAEVLHSGRVRRNLFSQGHEGVLRARAEPKELVVIEGADHLFDGKVAEVADAVEDLLGWTGMHEAVIVSRGEDGGRQGAERHAARHASRRARGGRRSRKR